MGDSGLIQITTVVWGRMETLCGGDARSFKDCKVWPGGAREWDWNETGTRHRPGIQPADVEELLAHEVEVIVLSRGMQLVLETCPETLSGLAARGVEVHVEETRAAVDLFNRLTRGRRQVGGLFHSTC
jgi:hypothetical protein